MSYNVVTIPPFDRQLKRLAKKFPSLKVEFAELVDGLEVNPEQGNAMSNNCYKIRVAIKSKGRQGSQIANPCSNPESSSGQAEQKLHTEALQPWPGKGLID